jgi:hypothetical protein
MLARKKRSSLFGYRVDEEKSLSSLVECNTLAYWAKFIVNRFVESANLDLESDDDVRIVQVTKSVGSEVSAVAIGRRNAAVFHHELEKKEIDGCVLQTG